MIPQTFTQPAAFTHLSSYAQLSTLCRRLLRQEALALHSLHEAIPPFRINGIASLDKKDAVADRESKQLLMHLNNSRETSLVTIKLKVINEQIDGLQLYLCMTNC